MWSTQRRQTELGLFILLSDDGGAVQHVSLVTRCLCIWFTTTETTWFNIKDAVLGNRTLEKSVVSRKLQTQSPCYHVGVLG